MLVATANPRFRGHLHAYAFICTALFGIIFIFTSVLRRFDRGICIYLIGQLLQYGVSAFYHIPSWPPKTKQILRQIDHICIFILIGATQTSLLLTTDYSSGNSLSKLIITASWAIAAMGIAKIVVMKRLHNFFDLLVYIAQGAIGIPFYRRIFSAQALDQMLVWVGALLYFFGGIIYGAQKPNLFPHTFGYHELFHAFTIAANMCFTIIISRKYVLELLSETYRAYCMHNSTTFCS